jgi:hypothetical protein
LLRLCPGAAEVVFEVLPDSQLPWLLIERGWLVVAADPPEGQRIVSGTIVEKFIRRADGELEPLTSESTKPVAEIRTHAGIVRTERYRFEL